jgi:hypothetical protein
VLQQEIIEKIEKQRVSKYTYSRRTFVGKNISRYKCVKNKICVMTCYTEPCALIMNTQSQMNMPALVMIIYLVYEYDCYGTH